MKGNDEADSRDRAAVARVLEGDANAFSEIVSRYQSKVLGMGIRFFRNRHSAEDFTQEAFLRIYQKLSTYRGESRFYSWLMRVAYNMAVDTRNATHYEANLDEITLSSDGRWGNPERRMLLRQAFSALRDALRRLPSAHALCVDLYFFFHLRYREISEITGLPVNTVKSNVFRAKSRLRAELENTAAEGFDGV